MGKKKEMEEFLEYENIGLYEELEDGPIDDIAGNGYWHLEKMREGVFALTVDCEEKHRTIFLSVESPLKYFHLL